MYLFYVDDSGEGHYYTFSAIGIPDERWRDIFNAVSTFRHSLRESDGIYVRKELHAWKFLSGRGRPSDKVLSRKRRAEIFKNALAFLATLQDQGLVLFNVAFTN